MLSLTNKHIVLGVSGGIAAYKSAELIRQLQALGAKVRVVMTQAAQAFITPLTLQTLSGFPVATELFEPTTAVAMEHIALARWADCIVIAPASADVIARLASGQANDLLTSVCLASTAPRLVAPAMNQQMWQDAATQANIQCLRERQVHIVGPAEGEQACGEVGPGRMLDVGALAQATSALFINQQLQGVRVLITAGPTREAIDPVRYLSNRSSGKMGYALAQAALEASADVCLIAGPVALTPPERVRWVGVETAAQMHDAVFTHIAQTDIFISVAAVADYTCVQVAAQKLAKSKDDYVLRLVPTVDILAAVCALPNKPFCVGFCAETDDLLGHAQDKLRRKGADVMAANWVGEGRGFESDDNALSVVWPGGQRHLPLTSKQQLAKQFMQCIAERYR